MSLYEVVLNSTLGGQNCVNRWNYVGSGTPAAVSLSFALASALGAIYDDTHVPPWYPPDTLLRNLSDIQANAVVWQQITVLNVYDPVDFYQTPFVPPYGGSISQGSAAPFVAAGFRTNVVNRSISRGTKRFVGVPDNIEVNNGVLDAGYVALMDTLAETMSSTLEYVDEAQTLTFQPCIVSKEEYTPDPEKPEKKAYRYYSTLAAQMARVALGINWESYPTVRSQVSRQYGRGS